MLEFSAYLDGSGKADSQRTQPFLSAIFQTKNWVTVAGAISPTKNWIAFEKSWQKVLDEYKVREFHANKFAAGHGEFLSWKHDKPKRSEFFKSLVTTIVSHTKQPLCYSTDVNAWHEIDTVYQLKELFTNPYVLSAFKAVGDAIRIANKRPLKVFLEDGDDGIPALQKLCEREFGIRPEKRLKSSTVAFQAADLIAWKNRTAATNLLRHMDSKIGLPLIVSIDAEVESLGSALILPTQSNLMSKRELLSTCNRVPIMKRPHLNP